MEIYSSIERILKLESHSNADSLDIASVLGWQVIVKKGQFKEGDLVVYIATDTIVPEIPEFEFLRKEKFRVKPIKLRGVVSQGIVFPLSILDNIDKIELKEGLDITAVLGIEHYEKPIPACMNGEVKGNFPTVLLSKTDEVRLQAYPELLEEFHGKLCYSTVKLDGTSATYVFHNNEFHVCGRNYEYKDTVENVYWSIAKKYNIENILKNTNIAIQGECVGPGIQGNPAGFKQVDFFIFNVVDITTRRILSLEDMIRFSKHSKIPIVPLDGKFKFDHNYDQLMEMSKGMYAESKNQREGIVIRPLEPCYSKTLQGFLSAKIINPNYKD